MKLRAVAAVMVALYAATRLPTAEPKALDDLIRQRAEAFVGQSPFLGIAVGVIDGDKVHAVCVGHRSLGGAAADENTLFEIGSVTKTFTGLLLADAVVRGEVTLEEPVGELLGPAVTVPKFEDHPIRLIDLATHTSGLPRIPDLGIFINPLNPYANFNSADLDNFISHYRLIRAPGAEYEYSNLGMGLLGNALANRAGKTYEQLVKQRICDPLGMSDTVITLSDDQNSRLATGTILGVPTMNWDVPALAGCGAIRSTLHDMLIYLRANLAPDKSPLAKAITLAHEPHFTIHKSESKPGKKQAIGLAWLIATDNGTAIIWHNGMTGGYATYLALAPARRWGVVVLGNQATSEIDHIGNDLLLDMLRGKLPAKNSPPAKSSPKADSD